MLSYDLMKNLNESENKKYKIKKTVYMSESVEIIDEITPNPKIGKSYAYILKHGIGGDVLPKDIKIKKYVDLSNGYTIVYLDRVLTPNELKKYDIPNEWEKIPGVSEFIDYSVMKESFEAASEKVRADSREKGLVEDEYKKYDDIYDRNINIDLGQLAGDIVDYFDLDMGNHFDEIQGNEEEVYDNALRALENKDFEIINRLIDEIEDKSIVDRLKKLYKQNDERATEWLKGKSKTNESSMTVKDLIDDDFENSTYEIRTKVTEIVEDKLNDRGVTEIPYYELEEMILDILGEMEVNVAKYEVDNIIGDVMEDLKLDDFTILDESSITVKDLIDDEDEAIDGYDKYLDDNKVSSDTKSKINHIKDEEKEHKEILNTIDEAVDPDLDTAREYINNFCIEEYGEPANFSDLNKIDIAYTVDEEGHEIQVSVNLNKPAIEYFVDDKLANTETYNSVAELNKQALNGLDFDLLIGKATDNLTESVDEGIETCKIIMFADTLREYKDVYIVDIPSEIDVEELNVVNKEGKLLMQSPMSNRVDYAARMEFAKINEDFYNEILEYYDDYNFSFFIRENNEEYKEKSDEELKEIFIDYCNGKISSLGEIDVDTNSLTESVNPVDTVVDEAVEDMQDTEINKDVYLELRKTNMSNSDKFNVEYVLEVADMNNIKVTLEQAIDVAKKAQSKPTDPQQMDNEIVKLLKGDVITEGETDVKGLKEIKNQGNIFMLEDENKKIIVGENYNKDENIIENAEIYSDKEQADKDYLDRIELISGNNE